MPKISRRSLLAGAGGSLAWPVLGAAADDAPAATETVAGKPPNIVFILADDMGYADPSCYGRPISRL